MSKRRAYWIKAAANLKQHKGRSLLQSLAVGLAVALLTAGILIATGIKPSLDGTARALNAPHLWLRLVADDDEVESLYSQMGQLDNVAQMTPLYTWYTTWLKDGEEHVQAAITPLRDPEPDVAHLTLVNGTWPQPDKMEGVVEIGVAETLGWDLDRTRTVDLVGPERAFAVRITGVVQDMSQAAYPLSSSALVYISPTAAAAMIPTQETTKAFWGMRFTDATQGADTVDAVRALMGDRAFSLNGRNYVVTGLSAMTGALIGFVTLFGLVALGASLLFLTGTMTAELLRQSKEIGVLQATGWRVRDLQTLYGAQSVAAILPGALLGVMAGQWGGRIVVARLVKVMGLRPYNVGGWWQAGAVVATASLLVAGVSWWVTRRIGRVSPAAAIHLGYRQPPARLARWLQQNRLPITGQLAFSLLFSRPLSSLIAILVLSSGIVAVLFAFILNATMREFNNNPANWGFDYDIQVRLAAQYDAAQAEQLLADNDNVAQFMPVTLQRAVTENKTPVPLKLVTPGQDLLSLPIITGRQFAAADEALVGAGFAQAQGIGLGDGLTVTIDDAELRLTIVGTYRELENLGRVAVGSAALLTGLDTPPKPSYYLARLRPDARAANVQAELERDSDGGLIVLDVADLLTVPFADLFPAALWGLSAGLILLAGVVIFNMTVIMSAEQQYAIGIMKAIGMGRNRLVGVTLSSLATLVSAALLIGLPLGFGLTRLLITLLSGRMGGVTAVIPSAAWVGGIALGLLPAALGFLWPFLQVLQVSPLATLQTHGDG